MHVTDKYLRFIGALDCAFCGEYFCLTEMVRLRGQSPGNTNGGEQWLLLVA